MLYARAVLPLPAARSQLVLAEMPNEKGCQCSANGNEYGGANHERCYCPQEEPCRRYNNEGHDCIKEDTITIVSPERGASIRYRPGLCSRCAALETAFLPGSTSPRISMSSGH